MNRVRLNDNQELFIDDPQAHLDALVEAGVLEIPKTGYGSRSRLYRLVRPHEHVWRVTALDGGVNVRLTCDGCALEYWQNNRLPIEMPL